MREGNSKIDKIYSTARSISTDSIYRLSQRRKGAQKDLEMALDSMEADRIASQLVQRTKAWIAELGGGKVDDDEITISGHSGSKLSEARTWEELSAKRKDSTIKISASHYDESGWHSIEVAPTKQALEKNLDTTIDISQLTLNAVNQRICNIEKRIENLRTGDWKISSE